MERDPFSSFNPESTPEKSDKDSKKEKSTEKRRSFADQIHDRKNEKQTTEKPGSRHESHSTEQEPTKKELAKEFLTDQADSLRDEIENHTSLEQAIEAQADLALVEAITEKLDNPDMELEPAVEEAYNELMEALEEVDSNATEQTEQVPDEDDVVVQQTTTFSTPPPSSSSSTNTNSGGGSGKTTPPTGSPIPPTPPPTQPVRPPRPPAPPLPPAGAVPPPHNPNFNLTPVSSPEEERRRVAGKVLVAGAVGYMIGRRGGRKRTEAKLNPEIKKRDETIIDLKKDIEQKEFNIRETAKKSYAEVKTETTRKPEIVPGIKEVLENKKNESEDLSTSPTSENPAIKTPVFESAEKPRVDNPKTIFETYKPVEKERLPQRSVEQISTPDLLRLAEKIIILDTTVRKLYETNQIDRRGLEELVKEHHLRHDLGPILDKRLLGKEAIQERAHEYRHDPSFGQSDDTDDVLKDSIPAHETVKTEAVASVAASHKEIGVTNTAIEQAAAQPLKNSDSNIQPQTKKKNQTATVAGIVVVAILIALLIIRLIFSL